jgi:hypothetical protein
MMTSFSRMVLCVAFVGLGSSVASAQQTLTFTNTDTDPGASGLQNQVVTLVAGSPVSIAPNGNITAQCALTGALCTGTGSGGGAAPTVTLTASNFSTTPTDGLYPAGTTFTLTPTVTGAEVCVRSVLGATPANTNWPATINAPPFLPQVVQMFTGEATYQFSIRCYGAGGATTFTLPDLRTAAGGGGGSCAGFTSNLPAGWSRGPLVSFSNVPGLAGGSWNPFPNSGQLGFIITNNNQYQSIGFNTPAADWTSEVPVRQFYWETAQVGGEADLSKVYVTISSCPGDFRIPATGSTAPTNDPTFARGCRSVRALGGAPNFPDNKINYEVSNLPATETICRLAPATTYYLNFIRATATDGTIGTPAEEAECQQPGETRCGVQMRVW